MALVINQQAKVTRMVPSPSLRLKEVGCLQEQRVTLPREKVLRQTFRHECQPMNSDAVVIHRHISCDKQRRCVLRAFYIEPWLN